MKRYFFVIVFLMAIGILCSVSASFTLSNFSIEKNYAPSGNLRGWINLSLQDEQANSLLSAFNSNITLLDFLKNANAAYTCFPSDCEANYLASAKETEKTFSLDASTNKIIGFKISGGMIESISGFSMNITSNAAESIYPQLSIDILDDNESEAEWRDYASSGSFGSEVYGCYKQAEATEYAEIAQTEYCEKMTFTFPYAANVEIGADVTAIQGGEVNFEMHIYNDDYDETCTVAANGTGKASCVVNLTLHGDREFFVCIKSKSSAGNNKYKLSYEQNSPCGFSGENNDAYTYDFSIFSKLGKYAPVGSFILNEEELEKAKSEITDIESYIIDYIDEKYQSNCTNGCIIPIKFISGKQQTIKISDARLSYTTGISKTTYDFYELEEKPAKTSMNFQKLDLEKAHLSVPSEYGKKTLNLKINGETIASQEIEIAQVPIINYVIPLSLPAAVRVKFIVFSSNASEYKWDFGDKTGIETTTENSTYHTYNSTGKYTLKVTAKNKEGESSKTFDVEVKSPKEEINWTLAVKRKGLNRTKNDITAVTGWYRTEIEKSAGLDKIEEELNRLEREYETASSSVKYVEIMEELLKLKVPDSLKSQEFSGAGYIPDPEKINPGYLIELGIKGTGDIEEYKEPIVIWVNEFLDISINNKRYLLDYGGEQAEILTSFILKIKPKKTFEKETYLIIEENYDGLVFKEEYKERAAKDATAITFSELKQDEEKTIEFISKENVEITELSFYISPEFSELPETGGKIAPCDYDKTCDKKLGENSENCPSDCRAWKRTILYLALLLFVAFVVYIILQEWYKRNYERHLFKSRNDLFNLINFINNAINQGLNKEEINKKLKARGWTGEQISYAIKKIQGKRTGMWEIPVFRWYEKRKMREELAKRQKNQIF